MGEFVRVLAASELLPGHATEAFVSGRPIALFNVGGAFHALSNLCVHRGGPLGQGVLDGNVVVCPWHAWAYDVATGVSAVNPDLKVACYETKVENGDVFVKVE